MVELPLLLLLAAKERSEVCHWPAATGGLGRKPRTAQLSSESGRTIRLDRPAEHLYHPIRSGLEAWVEPKLQQLVSSAVNLGVVTTKSERLGSCEPYLILDIESLAGQGHMLTMSFDYSNVGSTLHPWIAGRKSESGRA